MEIQVISFSQFKYLPMQNRRMHVFTKKSNEIPVLNTRGKKKREKWLTVSKPKCMDLIFVWRFLQRDFGNSVFSKEIATVVSYVSTSVVTAPRH